jgi:ABC-type uncharacterized transport system auxiliary subunit
MKRKHSVYAVLLAACVILSGCQHTPPNLTPHETAAFKGTQAIKTLDLIRDTAVAAHAQVPPLLDTATTRAVVSYHKASINVIHVAPDGWKPAVQTGLDELLKSLPANAAQLLTPYVTLLRTLLTEVSR